MSESKKPDPQSVALTASPEPPKDEAPKVEPSRPLAPKANDPGLVRELADQVRLAETHDPKADTHRLWELHYLVAGKPVPHTA